MVGKYVVLHVIQPGEIQLYILIEWGIVVLLLSTLSLARPPSTVRYGEYRVDHSQSVPLNAVRDIFECYNVKP